MRVFISGQKYLGAEILRGVLAAGHTIVGVCTPFDDKYLKPLAVLHDIPIINAGSLNYDTCPKDFDLGITAHSHDYIGYKTRYIPKHGWIGYHPSLLPRHRGRSAIEWALRMRDFATGGTVFWLNAGIDRGDIERQEMIWIDPKYFNGDTAKNAAQIWRDQLLPLGVRLIKEAVSDISKGVINKTPQDKRFSTFEPSLDIKDVFKPDLLMINAAAD